MTSRSQPGSPCRVFSLGYPAISGVLGVFFFAGYQSPQRSTLTTRARDGLSIIIINPSSFHRQSTSCKQDPLFPPFSPPSLFGGTISQPVSPASLLTDSTNNNNPQRRQDEKIVQISAAGQKATSGQDGQPRHHQSRRRALYVSLIAFSLFDLSSHVNLFTHKPIRQTIRHGRRSPSWVSSPFARSACSPPLVVSVPGELAPT